MDYAHRFLPIDSKAFNNDNVVANKWASSYMRQSADNMFTFSFDRVGGESDLADV